MNNRTLLAACIVACAAFAADATELAVRVSWGHRTRAALSVSVTPSEVEIVEQKKTAGGARYVAGLELLVRFQDVPIETIKSLHPIWRDLIAWSDPDTARRLTRDPAYRRDPRRLTFEIEGEPRRGFTVAVDQLLQEQTLWIPSLDIYIDAGARPVSFSEHMAALAARQGSRILDVVRREPEASYDQYKVRWEDMGNPAYRHPAQPAPGHIVCVTWDSAIPKFGIDRGGGIWNDYGNPDRFRLWFEFGDYATVGDSWRGQRLVDGFPVVVTTFEKDGLRYEIEEFAYPIDGPPAERRGDIAMALLGKLTIAELAGRERNLSLGLRHLRTLPADADPVIAMRDGAALLIDPEHSRALLAVHELDTAPTITSVADRKDGQKEIAIRLACAIPARGSREFIFKLPSPIADAGSLPPLQALDYALARAATLRFWSDYEARGARFRVPEQAVNELFRANLWHALRLPRRHGGRDPAVRIDLPYSNFAYDQNGSPWPVNQAIYVDYMIYDLRGYHGIAAEELAAMFRNNQEPNGHVKGYANWLVYTPSMLYAVAKNYLLSGDRAAFESLLPASLKAADWCLAELAAAKKAMGGAGGTGEAGGAGRPAGLVRGPLNDGTGEGYWAFNQAYLFAGLDLFSHALARYGHARASECRDAASELRSAIDRAFRAATIRSPLVQLRDGTWIPYVPCDVTRPGRLLDQWYPTDVDTGAVHLLRLKALPARGDLAESLLNDHEDNLFLHGWGMANEPVYNQQATAYILRDEPKAAIRAFYSMMACAFSHSAFEPVEHRWTHGQYFGPPSTDGAWFELFRAMLIQELDDGGLLLFAATPRAWLEAGKSIEIERAPTCFGTLSAKLESRAGADTIAAAVDLPASPGADRPSKLTIRFRHPQERPMRAVKVNGEPSQGFDQGTESVSIETPTKARYAVEVEY